MRGTQRIGDFRVLRVARDDQPAQRGRMNQVRQQPVDPIDAHEAQRLQLHETAECGAILIIRKSDAVGAKIHQIELAQLAQSWGGAEVAKCAGWKSRRSQLERLKLRTLADG